MRKTPIIIYSLSQDATDGRTSTVIRHSPDPSTVMGWDRPRFGEVPVPLFVPLSVTTHRGLAILLERLQSLLRGNSSMTKNSYTAIVEKDGDLYVALCPELDVASQGTTIEGATSNLKEAVELFLESADAAEIKHRLHSEVFITRFEAAHG